MRKKRFIIRIRIVKVGRRRTLIGKAVKGGKTS